MLKLTLRCNIFAAQVAFEKGVRLLEAEFGEYRDKHKKWEGLQRSRPTSDKLK